MNRSVETLPVKPLATEHVNVKTEKKIWVTPVVSEASVVDLTLANATGIIADGLGYS